MEPMNVRVREFNPAQDSAQVEALERLCEAGPSGSISIFADSLGNPLGRVSHFPTHTMLVAEIGPEIVGVIRAGIKEMVTGTRRHSPLLSRSAYILGLRVSPLHRRRGIGLELSRRIEAWCREQGAEVAYMATEGSNRASKELFIHKLGFSPARTPSILVHPVFQHSEVIPAHIHLAAIPAVEAAAIYAATRGAATPFFPARDLPALLSSPLCAGTFLATLARESRHLPRVIPLRKLLAGDALSSWAICSVWRTDQVFKLRVGGAPWRHRALAAASRAVDRAVPWLRLASFPDVFHSFGMHFVFGLAAQGPRGGELVAALWRRVMNLARENRCAVVVAEVGAGDPLIRAVPHWRSLSSMDDLWCVKRLGDDNDDDDDDDGEKIRPGDDDDLKWITDFPLDSPVFVDPRDV